VQHLPILVTQVSLTPALPLTQAGQWFHRILSRHKFKVFSSSKICVLVGTSCKILKTLITATKQRSSDLNVKLEIIHLCEAGGLSKAKQEIGMD
jgi:hypothetical protein